MGIAAKILAYVKSKPPYCQLYSQGFQSRIQNLHFESNLRKKMIIIAKIQTTY